MKLAYCMATDRGNERRSARRLATTPSRYVLGEKPLGCRAPLVPNSTDVSGRLMPSISPSNSWPSAARSFWKRARTAGSHRPEVVAILCRLKLAPRVLELCAVDV